MSNSFAITDRLRESLRTIFVTSDDEKRDIHGNTRAELEAESKQEIDALKPKGLRSLEVRAVEAEEAAREKAEEAERLREEAKYRLGAVEARTRQIDKLKVMLAEYEGIDYGQHEADLIARTTDIGCIQQADESPVAAANNLAAIDAIVRGRVFAELKPTIIRNLKAKIAQLEKERDSL